MSEERVFIPHAECWAANGACFEVGRCLHKCRQRLPQKDAISELAEAMRLMQELRAYILTFRSMTRYVDGSRIDLAMKESAALIARNKP